MPMPPGSTRITESTNDAVVVGGGLSGPMAAIELAARDWRVTVVEGRATLGGRARSLERDGFHLDLGPHTLYRAGATQRALDRLGLAVSGGSCRPRHSRSSPTAGCTAGPS